MCNIKTYSIHEATFHKKIHNCWPTQIWTTLLGFGKFCSSGSIYLLGEHIKKGLSEIIHMVQKMVIVIIKQFKQN